MSLRLDLFDRGPREVGRTRIWKKNTKDIYKWINNANGVAQDITATIYSFPGTSRTDSRRYDHAHVDKIMLDIDGVGGYGYEALVILHEILYDWGEYIHRSNFTGGHQDGRATNFHIFVWCSPPTFNKKGAIKGFQKALETELRKRLTEEIGIEFEEIIDPAVMGDLAQMARITGSYHPTKKFPMRYCYGCKLLVSRYTKYCKKCSEETDTVVKVKIRDKYVVPVYEHEMNGESAELILRRANNCDMNGVNPWMGANLVDLSEWDIEIKDSGISFITAEDFDDTWDYDPEDYPSIRSLPPCLRAWLGVANMQYTHRYHMILALRELGWEDYEVFKCLKDHLNPEYFDHCVEPSPGEDMINRVFHGNQQSHEFKLKCPDMSKVSYCSSDCRKIHPIYL